MKKNTNKESYKIIKWHLTITSERKVNITTENFSFNEMESIQKTSIIKFEKIILPIENLSFYTTRFRNRFLSIHDDLPINVTLKPIFK